MEPTNTENRPKPNKKAWIWAGSILVIVGAAAWLFVRDQNQRQAARGRGQLFVKPSRGMFRVTVTSTGELAAKNSIKVMGPNNARAAGVFQLKISKLVPEGTRVKTGDFVAELDKAEITNSLRNAEMDLQKAQSRWEQVKLDTTLSLTESRNQIVNLEFRTEEMLLRQQQAAFEAPAVKRQAELDYDKEVRALKQARANYATRVDQAVAKMREAEAELTLRQQRFNQINRALEEFTINAPADGIVIYEREWNGARKTVNSTVNAWDPVVASLPDLSRMESVTWVNEIDIQRVRVGQAVEIGLDADPAKRLQGSVTRVSNIGEQRPNTNAKVFEVKIELNDSDSSLLPGMTTSNTILVAEIPEALWIPLECIHTQDSINVVFRKDGLSLLRQEIRIGATNDNFAVITNGVGESDDVLLSLPGDPEKYRLVRLSARGENP